ncbi:tetratricopeptide repeat protein [Streptomyces sp. MMG1121]|uniref:tetratricopeptide repeat protein n=1 Tax=Streptomyces sp. MMG1121 TaxID=1415544 RepID=UPI0006AF1482|nr:tetratricopeptide repeat protein [Streptomyces sp. MMG1121]
MTAPGPAEGAGAARIVQNVYAFGGFAYGAIHADVHVHGDGRPVYLLTEHRPASGHPGRDGAAVPSRLLNAANAVVPFTGRTTELRELQDWCTEGGPGDGADLAVRWLHGPGGRGKTRLADQLAAVVGESGWKTVVARHGGAVVPESQGSHDARAGDRHGLLVLVDYADRWPLQDLTWLFANSMFDVGGRHRIPVRVLLLARTAHAWPAVRATIGDRAAPSDRELPPLPEDPGGRHAMFAAARTRFAEVYGHPEADAVTPPVPLDDPAFGLTLAVHMAALVAVDAQVHGRRPPQEAAGLSAYLLDRERENWTRLYENRTAGLDFATAPAQMADLVFVAALTGAQHWDDAVAALESTAIAGTPETVRSLLRDHARCYPPLDPATVLEPLYPDVLAEDFLALSIPGHPVTGHSPDPAAATVPKALLTSPGLWAWATRAVTVLAAAADRWPHVGERVLYPLLRERPDVALVAGNAALVALADITDVDAASLAAIETTAIEGLRGRPHIDLDTGLAAIALRRAEFLEPESTPARRAGLHRHLVVRLQQAGRWAEALEHAELSADLYADLARTDPDTFRRDLAGALSGLAVTQARTGRRAQALSTSERVVALYDDLAVTDPDICRPLLAEALGNHANRLADAGRGTEALDCSRRSLTLLEELCPGDPELYTPVLAGVLDNHATFLAEAGRHDEARHCADRAAAHKVRLAQDRPQSFTPMLAAHHHDDAIRWERAGDLTKAREASALAVEAYERLADVDPHVHLPALAQALTTHVGHLSMTGQRGSPRSLDLSRRAVELYERLADGSVTHLPDLARALRDRAGELSGAGHAAEALDDSRRAVELYERSPMGDADTDLLGLADALQAFALVRVEAETDLRAALTAASRAAGVYRDLVDEHAGPGLGPYVGKLLDAYDVVCLVWPPLGHADEAQRLRDHTRLLRGAVGPRARTVDPTVLAVLTETTDVRAMLDLGVGLDEAGLAEEAEAWLRRAAETDDVTAIALLIRHLLKAGRREESEPWLRRAADTGDVQATALYGGLLADTGRTAEAEPWLRRAAEAEDVDSMYRLAELLARTHRRDLAAPWYRRAADAGHVSAAGALGILLHDAGRPQEAEPYLHSAATAGNAIAMSNLGHLLYGTGRLREAEQWYRRAVDAGFDRALYDVAVLLDRTGRRGEAEDWFRRAAESGNMRAASAVGLRLCERGRLTEAEPWLRRAAEAGDVDAMVNLGLLMGRRDRLAEAEEWLRRAAEAGETGAMGPLGALLCESGRVPEAEPWLRRAAAAGDVNSMMNMGRVLFFAGRQEEATQWFQRAAAAGDPEAARLLRSRSLRSGPGEGGRRRRWRRGSD